MSDEDLREIYRNLHSSQDKYVYFILAVTTVILHFMQIMNY